MAADGTGGIIPSAAAASAPRFAEDGVQTAAIRPLVPTDVPTVAALHDRTFTDSLLRHLGPPYLRALYRAYLATPRYATLVYAPAAGVQGWVVVDLMPTRADAGRLARRHLVPLAGAALGALLARPWRLPPLARGALAMALHRWHSCCATDVPRAARPAGTAVRPSDAIIRYIAVAETARQRGVGQALLRAAEAVACRAGQTRMLVTTTVDNTPAIRLYERLGYRACRVWPGYDGRRFVQFARELRSTAASK
jgi:ribosomal protein S18 acetylase RimI-like enzyme